MASTNKSRFMILDPLRLIAAFAVVFYHYSIYFGQPALSFLIPIFQHGYLGVNFFFMLSGFVIMVSAQNRSAWEFAFARALRIYPAFILCLLFTVIVCYCFNTNEFTWKQLLSNSILLNDYLDIPNIDNVYWTLQAELKFYGCIFLLLLTGIFTHWRYWLGAWLLTTILYYFFKQPFFMGWFISPTYSFYFIGGVCSFLIHKYPQDYYVRVLFAISMVFSILSAWGQTAGFIAMADNFERSIASLIIFVIYIFFLLLAKGFFNYKRKNFLIFLGALSYPIYLIHNRSGKTIIENFIEDINLYLLLAGTICLVIIAAALIHELERLIHNYFHERIVFRKNITKLKRSEATPPQPPS